jgi:hypothetical protein
MLLSLEIARGASGQDRLVLGGAALAGEVAL